jgi:flagellar biosynthesis chaperone FliJ
MGLEVAQFSSEKMLRASQLSRKLSEDEKITSSLTQLVQQQAEVLQNLEENG